MRRTARSVFGIGLDVDGLELPAVLQADDNLSAAGDDVVVRQDDAGRIDDHPGAAPSRAVMRRPGMGAGELLEELVELGTVEADRRTAMPLKPKGISSPFSPGAALSSAAAFGGSACW